MSNPQFIPNLVSMLTAYPGSVTVANSYSSPSLAQNVIEYFDALIRHPYSGDLLVAEAPGYAGCALTGIPLTSEQIIAESGHPFIASLRSRLFRAGRQRESTATMVWNCFAGTSKFPAFWNTFPFHPHPAGQLRNNRKPTLSEAEFGASILDLVIQILAPRRVFALGRIAERALTAHFPQFNAPYIRHPSNGGHPAFIGGMISHNLI
jgi:uracil-DNA glycosylase